MGGTYGLGKTVLWKNSRLRLVMFHSALASPYIDRNGKSHWKRFFGHMRLPGHDIGHQAYKGEGFWGDRQGDVTYSVLDEHADQAAERLGMITRQKHHAGTSILVVDFDDPDVDDENEEELDTVERICESAELYYWPAMWDGRLRVRARAESQKPDAWKIAPGSRPELGPFVEAYTAAKMNKMKGAITVATHELNVPKGPNASDSETASKIVICTNLKTEDSDAPNTNINKTALIRGAGMVVGYQRIGRPGFGGNDFWAVVLGGKSCPDYLGLSVKEKERCEQLLASSEPVTHDIWTPNSEGLKKWRGARAQIVKILDGIKQAIAKATTIETKPEGRATSLLASMFPLSEGSMADGSRDMSLEVLQQPTLLSSTDGQLKYEFKVRVRVPGRNSFAEIIKPLKWRIECQYGFYGEDTHRKVIENVDLELTHKRTNGDWVPLSGENNWYEDFIQEDEVSCEIKGVTGNIESFLAFITKHELQVKVLKSY